MLNISPYLRQPCRSLAELRLETLLAIADKAERIRIWSAAIEHANGDEHDTLGLAIDHASDELARLEDRLDQLDDELGHRRDDDPGLPLVL
jgi:hypothetical protein